jgi:hypothetical protein
MIIHFKPPRKKTPPRYIALEIQILASDRHNNVAGINRVIYLGGVFFLGGLK